MITGKYNKLGTWGVLFAEAVYPHLDQNETCTHLHKLYTPVATAFVFNYSCIFAICFSDDFCLAFWSLDFSDPGLSLNLLRTDRATDKSFGLSSAIDDELHRLL